METDQDHKVSSRFGLEDAQPLLSSIIRILLRLATRMVILLWPILKWPIFLTGAWIALFAAPFVIVLLGIPLAVISMYTSALAFGVFLIKGLGFLFQLLWGLSDRTPERRKNIASQKHESAESVISVSDLAKPATPRSVSSGSANSLQSDVLVMGGEHQDAPIKVCRINDAQELDSTQPQPKRRHRRTHTGGSLSRSGASSPELVRTPLNASSR